MDAVVEGLRQSQGPSCAVYLQGISFVRFAEGLLTVSAPEWCASWVMERFAPAIRDAMGAERIRVEPRVGEERAA